MATKFEKEPFQKHRDTVREIRLGNIVQLNDLNGMGWMAVPITTFYMKRILDNENWVNPEPLSDAWLRQLGFTFDRGWFESSWNLGHIKLIYKQRRDRPGSKPYYLLYSKGRNLMVKVVSVHRLQNLVWELHGHDLTF